MKSTGPGLEDLLDNSDSGSQRQKKVEFRVKDEIVWNARGPVGLRVGKNLNLESGTCWSQNQGPDGRGIRKNQKILESGTIGSQSPGKVEFRVRFRIYFKR